MLVQRPVYEEFVERLGRATAAIKVGQPLEEDTEMGPLISAAQRLTAREYLEIGLAEGARHVTGGQEPDGPGFFMRPAVLADVGNAWRVAQEEIFGPVACVIARSNPVPHCRTPTRATSGCTRPGRHRRTRRSATSRRARERPG